MAAPYDKKMFDIELADKTDNIVILITRQHNETLVLLTLILLSVGMIFVSLWYICVELNWRHKLYRFILKSWEITNASNVVYLLNTTHPRASNMHPVEYIHMQTPVDVSAMVETASIYSDIDSFGNPKTTQP